jgi:hypothetical protein
LKKYQEEWEKFKKFCEEHGYLRYVPGTFGFMNTKTGNIYNLVNFGQVEHILFGAHFQAEEIKDDNSNELQS